MKCKYVFIILAAIILSANIVPGQSEKENPLAQSGTIKQVYQLEKSVDTLVAKTELVKKYQAESKTIQELITKRVNELVAADAVYNQLLGMKSNYEKLIKELKPTTNKQEVKK